MMESRGVNVRSKNVGALFKNPQPKHVNNTPFNALLNPKFASSGRWRRTNKFSNVITSRSIKRGVSHRRGLTAQFDHSEPSARKKRSRVDVNRIMMNRRNNIVLSDRFIKFLDNQGTGRQNPNKTYQNRLNDSVRKAGGRVHRRKLN